MGTREPLYLLQALLVSNCWCVVLELQGHARLAFLNEQKWDQLWNWKENGQPGSQKLPEGHCQQLQETRGFGV